MPNSSKQAAEKVHRKSIPKAIKFVLSLCAERTKRNTSCSDMDRWRSGCRRIILERPIRVMVDEALKAMDRRFDKLYGEDGRKSIPPERPQ